MGAAPQSPGPHESDAGQDLMNRVIDALVRAEATTVDDPHIVVVRCVSSGETTFAGPYPDGLAALLAAEREAALLCDDADEIHISVAALAPPV